MEERLRRSPARGTGKRNPAKPSRTGSEENSKRKNRRPGANPSEKKDSVPRRSESKENIEQRLRRSPARGTASKIDFVKLPRTGSEENVKRNIMRPRAISREKRNSFIRGRSVSKENVIARPRALSKGKRNIAKEASDEDVLNSRLFQELLRKFEIEKKQSEEHVKEIDFLRRTQAEYIEELKALGSQYEKKQKEIKKLTAELKEKHTPSDNLLLKDVNEIEDPDELSAFLSQIMDAFAIKVREINARKKELDEDKL